eukprot:TRINITY_DN10198_c0_g1_i2.p1 TRINITY_DN10198_c0_g1~~TRINITY_DN10198_c0_g1_i2.p1  ORF type:complete len:218 (-),score=54.20 TRINITY_DN10198_c0_g1_i2:69-644(-)
MCIRDRAIAAFYFLRKKRVHWTRRVYVVVRFVRTFLVFLVALICFIASFVIRDQIKDRKVDLRKDDGTSLTDKEYDDAAQAFFIAYIIVAIILIFFGIIELGICFILRNAMKVCDAEDTYHFPGSVPSGQPVGYYPGGNQNVFANGSGVPIGYAQQPAYGYPVQGSVNPMNGYPVNNNAPSAYQGIPQAYS